MGSEEALLVRRERNSANSKRREETKQQPGTTLIVQPLIKTTFGQKMICPWKINRRW